MSFAIIVDTETTSIDPATGSLVEVASAKFDLEHGKLVDARSFLLERTQGEHGAEEVHGIPAELVARYGLPASTLDGLKRYCTGAVATIAHNAAFDRQWLAGIEPWACSMDFEWPRPVQSRSLTAIALAHGVGVVAAHRALDDVLTLARVLERCKEMGADLVRMVERALRPKVLVQAIVSYDDRDKAKAARFTWEAEKKRWVKLMFADEVAALGFPTKEVAA